MDSSGVLGVDPWSGPWRQWLVVAVDPTGFADPPVGAYWIHQKTKIAHAVRTT